MSVRGLLTVLHAGCVQCHGKAPADEGLSHADCEMNEGGDRRPVFRKVYSEQLMCVTHGELAVIYHSAK